MRRIDHVVVAVHDLEAAAAFYERLGFQVGARNRHPWGTENRLVQFERSFIELITVGDVSAIPEHGPRHFSFGAFVRDYLRRQEGIAMLVLDSADAKADAALFDLAGVGSFDPFFFERKGRRPDGREVHVAFTLAFAAEPEAHDAGFFVCQQHFPENFWNPTFQRHENGATGLCAIGMTAARPEDHASFLGSYSGASPRSEGDNGFSVALNGGTLNVRPGTSGEKTLRLTSVSTVVPDLSAQARRLKEAAIRFKAGERALHVCKDVAFGTELVFRESDAS